MESKGNEESVKAMTVIPAASTTVATLKVGNKSILTDRSFTGIYKLANIDACSSII